ncbi:hypothetical protein TNCV_79401 [Trichonephila clavipes]|nr:hypothetical protein TNCV_79401 [Trichonephila clavipes]
MQDKQQIRCVQSTLRDVKHKGGFATQSNMCWCTIMHESHVLVRSGWYSLQKPLQLWEIFVYEGFFNLKSPSKSPHSFGYSPRRTQCRPEDYYYRDFH